MFSLKDETNTFFMLMLGQKILIQIFIVNFIM